MDTIKKINTIIGGMILISFVFYPIISLAIPYAIDPIDDKALSLEAFDNYNNVMSNPNVIWGKVATIDCERLAKTDTLKISLGDEQLELYAVYKNHETNYTYTHYLSLNSEEEATISILGSNVVGNVSANSGLYHITSISENKIALVKYEFDIPDDPDEIDFTENIELPQGDENNTEASVSSTTPVIRVLFLFTSSALTLVGSPQSLAMRNVVYTYINQANESFANSNINAHLELAYLGPTNYNESAHSWDDILDHFYGTSDGYIDEVHTLRNQYSADVCVLFINKNGLCGEAKTIKANDEEAFCIVCPSFGCNDKYTAIHEIGHLIGCRHNYSQDSNLSPYMYGHGYYHYEANNHNSSWRTMMSYENSCTNGCRRILYWSNPDINYNGIATGSIILENNARVWNERAGTVSDFYGKKMLISLSGTNNNTVSLYESHTASLSIHTSGGYEVQSGQTVDFSSSITIQLSPNTHIKSGANFRASISSNSDVSPYPQFNARRYADSKKENINFQFEVHPNPVYDILTITTNEELVQISIYNMNGQCVLQTKEMNIYVAHLSTSVYLIRALTSNGRILQSKFIKQ